MRLFGPTSREGTIGPEELEDWRRGRRELSFGRAKNGGWTEKEG
jgi:hypothetical protein